MRSNGADSDPAAARRLARERRTIAAMVALYCRAHHQSRERPCVECRELLDYAERRIGKCPHAANKPACSQCPTHCFRPDMRERVRRVMRHAGPRMLFRHPILTVWHWLDGRARRRT